MQQPHINQILSWQHITPALSELRWLPAGFKVLVLTFKTLDAGSLLKACYQTAISGGILVGAQLIAKTASGARFAKATLVQQFTALNCQMCCLSSYFFLRNLEKDDLRDELAFLFYELIPKLSIGVPGFTTLYK